MANWLKGQQIMSRPQITSFFWDYIKKEGLLVSDLCHQSVHPVLIAWESSVFEGRLQTAVQDL